MLLFRHKLLKLLLAREKICPPPWSTFFSRRVILVSLYFRAIPCLRTTISRDNAWPYICHPPMALDRSHYDPPTRQVAYYPKIHDHSDSPEAPAAASCSGLDFLAGLCTHIPDAGQQLIDITARLPMSAAPAPDKQQPRRRR